MKIVHDGCVVEGERTKEIGRWEISGIECLLSAWSAAAGYLSPCLFVRGFGGLVFRLFFCMIWLADGIHHRST